jgi:hypothetical protein
MSLSTILNSPEMKNLVSSFLNPTLITSNLSVGSKPMLNFRNLRGIELELVLNAIDDTLKVASKYNGYVFGGYVRDVLVPTELKGKQNTYNFKDVDIWFSNQTDADAFVAEMGVKFVSTFINVDASEIYDFNRKQYHLTMYDICLAWIDVVVSDKYPVNDFNVNMLAYKYESDKLVSKSMGIQSELELKKSIINKKLDLLPGYFDKLLPKSTNYANKNLHRERLINRYFKREWKVYFGSAMLNCDSDEELACTVQYINKCRK